MAKGLEFSRRRKAATSRRRDAVLRFCCSAVRPTAIHAAAAEGHFDKLANLVDLHRIQLTYVTNKKGGDQILSALESEVREVHAVMGNDYSLGGFAMELISGGVDIGGIQSVIRRAEEPF